MPEKPKTYRPACHRPRPREPRPSAAARGYDHKWREFRLSYLAKNPLCLDCQARGLTVEATEVDHVRTLRSGADVYDAGNLRALCKPCHSRKTGRFDRRPRADL